VLPVLAAPAKGQQVGPIVFDVTYERCVLCVSATRDFNPLHYDRDAARAAGLPDVFINTMTYQGLFARLVLEWAGSAASLERLAIRMRQVNIPGDTLTLTGTVAETGEDADGRWASLELVASNQRVGATTTAEARVRWPA
jgi:acyl dehydratase